MCRNSFGPCAFACGPRTPVMRNCAAGKRAPSIAMNGMVPPSPIHIALLPELLMELVSMAAASHGAVGGACQPLAAWPYSNITRAAHGGSASEVALRLRAALA